MYRKYQRCPARLSKTSRARARSKIGIYGQELNYATWRLAKMNLAICGIDGRIEQDDSFTNDCFPDLEADCILANPPFNLKSWGGEYLRPACRACGTGREDKRWKYGVPPVGNANFAWVQHLSACGHAQAGMIHHLAPTGLGAFKRS